MTRTDQLKAAHAAILAAGPFVDSEAAGLLATIRQGMGKSDGEAHILAAEDAIYTQLEADALEQEEDAKDAAKKPQRSQQSYEIQNFERGAAVVPA